MLALITGGSGSGKSAWAEDLTCTLEPGEKFYLAAMDPSGQEAQARIARHRRLRAGKGFSTVECPYSLSRASGGTALLECMSNLTANVMFSPCPPASCVDWIWGELSALIVRCRHLVIVSNEVFSDGFRYDASTMRYLSVLGALNRRIAAQADLVAEVVCGIPVFWKKPDGFSCTETGPGGRKSWAWEGGTRPC